MCTSVIPSFDFYFDYICFWQCQILLLKSYEVFVFIDFQVFLIFQCHSLLLISCILSRILSSQNPLFKEGELVAGPFGWCTHAISKGHGVQVLSDFGDFPPTYGLGVLGMPG